jgi:hypothetical protein
MANYNCTDSQSNAYGAGSYGTCTQQTQSVGAPNTGVFQELVSSGSFTIILPLIVTIVVVLITTFIIKSRKRKPTR